MLLVEGEGRQRLHFCCFWKHLIFLRWEEPRRGLKAPTLRWESPKAIPCDSKSPALSGPTWGGSSLALGFTWWPRRQFTHGASSAMLVLKLALKVPPEYSFPDFLRILLTQSPVESLCAQMSWSHHHLKQTLSQTSVQRSGYAVPEDIRSMELTPWSFLCACCGHPSAQNCPAELPSRHLWNCWPNIAPLLIIDPLLVTCHCLTNYLTFNGLKQHTFVTLQFLWFRTLGSVWLDDSRLWLSQT